MPSVRVVLVNAAERDWEIHQIDVKSAYLQAPLKETIYMRPPRGVLKSGQEGKVCRLLEGLYGLKQAGCGWYQELTKVMVRELDFKRSALDHSVFYRKCGEEHTIVAVATDDMALTSKRASDVVKLKSEISQYWQITDGGEMHWYLGFAIKRDQVAQTISINQQAYIEAMLNKFWLTNVRPVSTSMESRAHLTKDQKPSMPTQAMRMSGMPYAEAIGCVLWPVMITQPDCAFVIGILSQFIQNPGNAHWEALTQVMVYLGSMKDLWLTFGGRSQKLVEGFCDSNYANQQDRHSIAGFAYRFRQGAISWSSKKQQVIALSTVEAKYIAQAHTAKEALWLHSFISEI